MKQFTFSGITGMPTQIDKGLVDEFGENCFIYDKVFQHKEEGLNFNYMYALEIIGMDSATGEEGTMFNLYLTIHKDSLSDKVVKEVLNGDDFEINPYDLIMDGRGAILLGSEIYNVEDWNEIEEIAYNILSFIPMVDGMRGFYLDKAWNRIGTTGWDSIEYALGKRENLFSW